MGTSPQPDPGQPANPGPLKPKYPQQPDPGTPADTPADPTDDDGATS